MFFDNLQVIAKEIFLMRKVLVLALVLVLVSACDFPFQIVETFFPERTEVSVGEEFVIPLYIAPMPEKEIQSANSFSVRLSYPTTIELVGVDPGEALSKDENTALLAYNESDGKLRVAYADAHEFALNGELIRFRFRAIERGTSFITVEAMRFNEGQFTEVKTTIGGIYIN